MTAKKSGPGHHNPGRYHERAADQDHRLTVDYGTDRRQNPITELRAMVYVAGPTAGQREPLLAFLRLAERLMEPPAQIVYGQFPDLRERRRRALTPRPNSYFPGGPDYRGRRL